MITQGDGDHNCKRSDLYDHCCFGSFIADLIDRWISDQYFSDSYIHSGTDIDLCTKDHRSFSWNHVVWFLDVRHYVKLHDAPVDRL